MINQTDIVVIGAGAVGLAITKYLSKLNKDVLLIEKNNNIGEETSSRNSEVVHAGIYYPTNSLKAKLCIKGKKLLYDYCKEKKIFYKKCGKLIISQEKSDKTKLDIIENQAKKNGLTDLKRLTSKEMYKIEPEIECLEAIYSPSTGFFDSTHFMQSLREDIENSHGSISLNSKVIGGTINKNYIDLIIDKSGKITNLKTKYLINAGGLYSTNIIKKFINFPKEFIPNIFYTKGTYFNYLGKNPFKHLIYPLPEKSGLGIHITLDKYNKIKFGPDTELTNIVEYEVNEYKVEKFYKSIKTFWPNVVKENILPGYCGIRPKLYKENIKENDFVIQGPINHRIQRLVNLFAIESPGLTSSLAIGKYIRNLLFK